jgi:hypothetical protein
MTYYEYKRLTWPWRPLQRQPKSILQFPRDYESMRKYRRRTGISGDKSLTPPNEHSSIQTGLKESQAGCCEAHRKLGAMCHGYPYEVHRLRNIGAGEKRHKTYEDSIHRPGEISLEQTINGTLHIFDVCSRQLVVIIVRSDITCEDCEGVTVSWKHISHM